MDNLADHQRSRGGWCRAPCALTESAPAPQALKGAMFGEVADVVEMEYRVGMVEHRPFHAVRGLSAFAHRDVRAVGPSAGGSRLFEIGTGVLDAAWTTWPIIGGRAVVGAGRRVP